MESQESPFPSHFMSSSKSQLGSLGIQAPVLNPQIVHVSATTCNDMSLFKDLLREYRKLDDTVTMRLNRANAVMRDRAREQSGRSGQGTIQDQACSYLWQELMANWSRRTQLVQYCVDVVDKSLQDKKDIRKAQAEMYIDQVKRTQIHRELTVEAIVRKRSVDAFRSRCRYFEPPATDE
ncbi:caffeine-induced death protein 2-domain-containing protein [Armillaria borealis]|uniref:Caffeine-induced death protein 2-domain-containing protein n=1 Tax=Armillaria borealis TaxID=47425 RepID=A0AA39N175_9AGAR|nr:caffeine-induced death protein 2-domain-containing protein [Armillaria borealis]